MVMTDPIADMLTRLRNGIASRKEEIAIPYSQLKVRVAELLKKEGYLGSVKVVKKGSQQQIIVTPKYAGGQPVIRKLRRISRPGCRFYLPAESLRPVLGGYGISVVSTSSGLMTNKEARRKHLGGELLFEVY